jgi:hypothetical protein
MVMPKQDFWLGIIGDITMVSPDIKDSWWCLPDQANQNDKILLYCPYNTSKKNQGIFSQGKLVFKPKKENSNNFYCAGYGATLGRQLFYAEIKIEKYFERFLTAKMIKADLVLKESNFVRRNFQGTVFKLDEPIYKQIIKLLKEVNRNK